MWNEPWKNDSDDCYECEIIPVVFSKIWRGYVYIFVLMYTNLLKDGSIHFFNKRKMLTVENLIGKKLQGDKKVS